MAQAMRFLKNKVESVFYVSHLNLAACMAIMIPVHSLHLPRNEHKTDKWGGFQTKHHH